MVYIRSTSNISPQATFGQPLPDALAAAPVVHTGNRLRAMEPDYNRFIDAKMMRRMSRVIRMGVAAAMECLQRAGAAAANGSPARAGAPDAIITGTAYGCLEDTGIFLQRMIENNEEMLTPTAFIQSTHNTVGAQIALMLKNHGYNNTFVHRGWSFESALLDAFMYLGENEGHNVLVGGLDEVTEASHTLLSRFGLYKAGAGSNLDLFTSATKGTIAGEGAAFFLLTNREAKENLARLDGLTTFYKPQSVTEAAEHILAFLHSHELDIRDINLVITGRNGNIGEDRWYDAIREAVFPACPVEPYKHLSGEYPTSVGYALWMAAGMVASQGVVTELVASTGVVTGLAAADKGLPADRLRRILIYNQYQQTHHSLLLVSSC
jgi:3-oxoacyl-[acyl-carrier-protein] synthase II